MYILSDKIFKFGIPGRLWSSNSNTLEIEINFLESNSQHSAERELVVILSLKLALRQPFFFVVGEGGGTAFNLSKAAEATAAGGVVGGGGGAAVGAVIGALLELWEQE